MLCPKHYRELPELPLLEQRLAAMDEAAVPHCGTIKGLVHGGGPRRWKIHRDTVSPCTHHWLVFEGDGKAPPQKHRNQKVMKNKLETERAKVRRPKQVAAEAAAAPAGKECDTDAASAGWHAQAEVKLLLNLNLHLRHRRPSMLI
jgi:hypothetical protein